MDNTQQIIELATSIKDAIESERARWRSKLADTCRERDKMQQGWQQAIARIEQLEKAEAEPIVLEFGDGKVCVGPLEYKNDPNAIGGIALSLRLGSGPINSEHPTIRKGDAHDPAMWDVTLKFKNQASLDVLKWAISVIESEQAKAALGEEGENGT